MPIDQTTPSRAYPLPHADNTLAHDVERLRQALGSLDADVRDLVIALGLKAAISHTHVINDIVGLQGALDGKLGVGAVFALNDLSDVDVSTSDNDQVLTKSGTQWIPASLTWSRLGGRPTTLAGYGISDAAPAAHDHDSRYYTQAQILTLLTGKAPSAHTHAIGDITGLFAQLSSLILRGHIDGLTLSNNGTSAINLAAGQATSDDGSYLMSTAGLTNKSLGAPWAVGSAAGARDTGTAANSTWYHTWLIARPDTGVVDVLFSNSATNPTLPANYTKKRRIGAIYNNSSGNIATFIQYGDEFWWNAAVIDADEVNPGTAAVARTVSTPAGIKTQANVAVALFNASTTVQAWLSPLDSSNQSVQLGNAATLAGFATTSGQHGAASTWMHSIDRVWTNTSSQIRTRVSVSNSSTRFGLITRGWIDPRGRDA